MSETDDGNEKRIEDLEIMAAHQAQMIEDLSEELQRASAAIERMQRSLRSLGDRFEALADGAMPRPENTKPPHY